MPKTQDQETQTPVPSNLKPAPAPGGNFVKMKVGMTCTGTMESARMEVEKKKDKKNKVVEKDRYHFALKLDKDTAFMVGRKKKETEQLFRAGQTVILPEHGFLISTLRRTACEIKAVPYVPNEDTDLTPLVGKYFQVTRREDGEITGGEFAGTASALYDIHYGDAPAQA